MLKFLLLAALVLWLLYSPGVRQLLRGGQSGDSPRPAPKTPPAPERPVAMVPCAHCGIHLPTSEALLDQAGRPFCSESHRRAGPGRA